MAILRAGPFATSDNPSTGKFFQDEPDSASNSVLPVNCAMNNWASSPWRTFFTTSDGILDAVSGYEGYDTGVSGSFSITKTANSGGANPGGFHSSKVSFSFRTQAVVPFNANVTASASQPSGGGGTIIFTVNGVSISDEEQAIISASITASNPGASITFIPFGLLVSNQAQDGLNITQDFTVLESVLPAIFSCDIECIGVNANSCTLTIGQSD
jgi:hypothetical protein